MSIIQRVVSQTILGNRQVLNGGRSHFAELATSGRRVVSKSPALFIHPCKSLFSTYNHFNVCNSNKNTTANVFTIRGTGIQKRMYGGGKPARENFDQRALEVLRGFEKIDASKLTLDADFNKDLGLDSLDTVEVLMAIEDEFMVEIPDQEADGMHNLRQAVDFVYERWSPEHYM